MVKSNSNRVKDLSGGSSEPLFLENIHIENLGTTFAEVEQHRQQQIKYVNTLLDLALAALKDEYESKRAYGIGQAETRKAHLLADVEKEAACDIAKVRLDFVQKKDEVDAMAQRLISKAHQRARSAITLAEQKCAEHELNTHQDAVNHDLVSLTLS